METLSWADFEWMNPPEVVRITEGRLGVRAGHGTDFWRTTSYGFILDNGHFLGAPFGDGGLELSFEGEFESQFDQAGLMLWANPHDWLKAGVELSDGTLHASVVVTHDQSDWSVQPLSVDGTRRFTVRISRVGDSVTVRFGAGEEPPTRLLRVTHLPADVPWRAGPYCCAPKGPGFEVRFEPLRVGEPDRALHEP